MRVCLKVLTGKMRVSLRIHKAMKACDDRVWRTHSITYVGTHSRSPTTHKRIHTFTKCSLSKNLLQQMELFKLWSCPTHTVHTYIFRSWVMLTLVETSSATTQTTLFYCTALHLLTVNMFSLSQTWSVGLFLIQTKPLLKNITHCWSGWVTE